MKVVFEYQLDLLAKNLELRLIKKEKGIVFGLICLPIECLSHLFWGYSEPAEEGDKYWYYDAVDELR
jgi:hypothetical protein